MSDRADIGETLTVRFVDGRVLELRPTFGDLARFEDEQGVPAWQRFEAGYNTSTTARLGWYAATRTRTYAGTYAEWLEALGDASSMPDERVPAADADT